MNANQYVQNRLKTPKDFERKCSELFTEIVFKTKDTTYENINNRNRAKKVHILRKNTNFNQFVDHTYMSIILSSSTRVELQTYSVSRSIIQHPPYEEVIKIKLVNLSVLANDEVVKIGLGWSDSYVFGHLALGYMGYSPTIHKYKYDYCKEILRSPLKYTGIEKYRCNFKSVEVAYKYRLMLEMLKNIGGENLYYEIISGRVEMRTVNKKFIKSNKHFIKSYNPTFAGIFIYRVLLGDFKMNEPNLELIKFSHINVSEAKRIIKFQNQNGIQGNKLFIYLLKNGESFSYYNDYFNIITQLNINDGKKSTLYPKNLETNHNLFVEVLNSVKRELDENQMKIAIKRTRKLKYENSDFVIFPPDSLQQIIDEGISLKHCVGLRNYLDDHLSGDTNIMFVREKEKMDIPLYTVEYKNKKIVQLRGLCNAPASTNAQEFVESWLGHLTKKKLHLKMR